VVVISGVSVLYEPSLSFVISGTLPIGLLNGVELLLSGSEAIDLSVDKNEPDPS
jgi:hypothetical protein